MTVLDASAVLAYLRGEPSSAEVAGLLRGPAVLTSVSAAEVHDQMVRVFGSDPDAVEADLALLCHAGMTLLPVSAELAAEAGRIRARRYHREQAAVSVADCVAAAAALQSRQPVATADPALADLLRAEGGQVHPLTDSKGRRP
jgi:ribonuclease VapC